MDSSVSHAAEATMAGLSDFVSGVVVQVKQLILSIIKEVQQDLTSRILSGTCRNVQGTDHLLNRWFI